MRFSITALPSAFLCQPLPGCARKSPCPEVSHLGTATKLLPIPVMDEQPEETAVPGWELQNTFLVEDARGRGGCSVRGRGGQQWGGSGWGGGEGVVANINVTITLKGLFSEVTQNGPRHP